MAIFSEQEVERYARHLVLREVGGTGQQRLKNASVLVVGAGGLGSPALLYLAAAGVGRVVVVDPDKVERSNLQRQILFGESDIGRAKVLAAAERLGDQNPHIEIEAVYSRLDLGNADALVGAAKIVLDGTDNFETRMIVADACVRHGRILVTGAVGRWGGQVAVLSARPCYRCLVPGLPPDEDGCAAAGVIGALDGVVGSMMALEAIKVITGAGEPLLGRLLVFDGLASSPFEAKITADPHCPACGCLPRSGS